MFFFRAERTGTNVKGFGLMSHVPVIPLKVYVLSVVHILARGNPQQTTETDLGCVGAREASVLRSTEHHPHEFRFVLPSGLMIYPFPNARLRLASTASGSPSLRMARLRLASAEPARA